ncbi:YuzD family protein [Neobacillus sp. SM06]|uniref:YuzD family protein n=1 Tax=Neobacillus sp. SM06 TaxID=3422492 RepID=UPI003D283A3B
MSESQGIEIVVYGAEEICQSCVRMPSSKETLEWLQAAITRKFPNQPFVLTYVDLFNPPVDKTKEKFAKKVLEEEMFYPVVVINEQVVGEGDPRLKTIFAEMEKYGYKAES